MIFLTVFVKKKLVIENLKLKMKLEEVDKENRFLRVEVKPWKFY